MQVIDPSKLSPRSRELLGEQLYSVHARVFEAPNFDRFFAHVVESPKAYRTSIGLHRTEGQLAGYSAVHMFEVEINGTTMTVMRGESGLLPEARGGAPMGKLWVREIAQAMRTHKRPVHYFGCHVHPSAYLALGRLVPNLRPRPGVGGYALASEMADFFELARDPRDPLVREVGWVTRESSAARQRWREKEDPLVQFYLRENPRYSEGLGLPVVAKFGPLSLAKAYASHALS